MNRQIILLLLTLILVVKFDLVQSGQYPPYGYNTAPAYHKMVNWTAESPTQWPDGYLINPDLYWSENVDLYSFPCPQGRKHNSSASVYTNFEGFQTTSDVNLLSVFTIDQGINVTINSLFNISDSIICVNGGNLIIEGDHEIYLYGIIVVDGSVVVTPGTFLYWKKTSLGTPETDLFYYFPGILAFGGQVQMVSDEKIPVLEIPNNKISYDINDTLTIDIDYKPAYIYALYSNGTTVTISINYFMLNGNQLKVNNYTLDMTVDVQIYAVNYTNRAIISSPASYQWPYISFIFLNTSSALFDGVLLFDLDSITSNEPYSQDTWLSRSPLNVHYGASVVVKNSVLFSSYDTYTSKRSIISVHHAKLDISNCVLNSYAGSIILSEWGTEWVTSTNNIYIRDELLDSYPMDEASMDFGSSGSGITSLSPFVFSSNDTFYGIYPQGAINFILLNDRYYTTGLQKDYYFYLNQRYSSLNNPFGYRSLPLVPLKVMSGSLGVDSFGYVFNGSLSKSMVFPIPSITIVGETFTDFNPMYLKSVMNLVLVDCLFTSEVTFQTLMVDSPVFVEIINSTFLVRPPRSINANVLYINTVIESDSYSLDDSSSLVFISDLQSTQLKVLSIDPNDSIFTPTSYPVTIDILNPKQNSTVKVFKNGKLQYDQPIIVNSSTVPIQLQWTMNAPEKLSVDKIEIVIVEDSIPTTTITLPNVYYLDLDLDHSPMGKWAFTNDKSDVNQCKDICQVNSTLVQLFQDNQLNQRYGLIPNQDGVAKVQLNYIQGSIFFNVTLSSFFDTSISVTINQQVVLFPVFVDADYEYQEITFVYHSTVPHQILHMELITEPGADLYITHLQMSGDFFYSPPDEPAPKPNHLSAILIGVLVPVFVIAVALVLVLLYYRRKNPNRTLKRQDTLLEMEKIKLSQQQQQQQHSNRKQSNLTHTNHSSTSSHSPNHSKSGIKDDKYHLDASLTEIVLPLKFIDPFDEQCPIVFSKLLVDFDSSSSKAKIGEVYKDFITLSKRTGDESVSSSSSLSILSHQSSSNTLVQSTDSLSIKLFIPDSNESVSLECPKSQQEMELRHGKTIELKFGIQLMCTTRYMKKAIIVINQEYYTFLYIALESELTTILDYNELVIQEPPIGEGAYGTVYCGTYRGSKVAIKKLKIGFIARNPTLLNDVAREMDLMQRLRHQNIVSLIGVVKTPQNMCIVTEFITNGSLAHVIYGKGRKLVIQEKLRISLDIVSGMMFLHECGVIHRDLKPDNVLVVDLAVNAQVCVKLTDFGTSKESTMIEMTTQTNGIGTPIYQSPEILNQGVGYDNKVDVYSFGMTLYELMIGQVPFQTDEFKQSPWAIPNYVLEGKRPTFGMNEIDPDIQSVINLCWHHDPQQRPTFVELFSIITKLLEMRLQDDQKQHQSI